MIGVCVRVYLSWSSGDDVILLLEARQAEGSGRGRWWKRSLTIIQVILRYHSE